MTTRQSHAMGIVLGGMLGQTVLLFVLQIVLARLFGAGLEVDAYQAAMNLPTVLAAMLAGPLCVAFVPTWQRLADRHDPAADSLLLGLTGVLTVATGLLAGLGTLYARPLMQTLQPGFSGEQTAIAAQLFVVLGWTFPGNVLIALFQAALNCRSNFFVPALAGVLGPACTVALTVFLSPQLGILALAWGVLAGSILSVGLQALVLLPRQRWFGRASLRAPIRDMGCLAIPVAAGMILLKFDPLVDRYLLSSLDAGSLAHWGYAGRLSNLFLMVTSGALSTVAFPRLARSASRGDAALAAEFALSLRLLTWVAVPTLAVLGGFSTALVHDLFQRGQFGPQDTQITASLLSALSGMVIGAGLGEICGKTFFSRLDTRTPLLVTAGTILGLVAGKIWLIPLFGLTAAAWTNSVVYVASAAVQLSLLQQKLGSAIYSGLPRTLLRCLAATALTLAWGLFMLWLAFPYAGTVGLISGAALYFTILHAVGELNLPHHVPPSTPPQP